jgi:hypothetical protein
MSRVLESILLAGLLGLSGCARGALSADDPDAAISAATAGDATVATGSPRQASDASAPGDGDAVGEGGAAHDDDVSRDASASERDAGARPEPECKPGTYVGTFSGNISAFFIVNLPIAGTLRITALTASQGDDLVIDTGRIEGQDQDGNPVSADVRGVVRCATKQLEGGELDNGMYTRRSVGQTVRFDGTAQATYRPGDIPIVEGTWMTRGGIESGAGSFSAALTP